MPDRTYTDKMKSAPIAYDELLASHKRLLAALEAARRYIEYNIPATEANGKLLYSIRETLAKAKGEAG